MLFLPQQVCKAVGLSDVATKREQTVKVIAQRGDRDACTLKIECVDVFNFLLARRPLDASDEHECFFAGRKPQVAAVASAAGDPPRPVGGAAASSVVLPPTPQPFLEGKNTSKGNGSKSRIDRGTGAKAGSTADRARGQASSLATALGAPDHPRRKKPLCPAWKLARFGPSGGDPGADIHGNLAPKIMDIDFQPVGYMYQKQGSYHADKLPNPWCETSSASREKCPYVEVSHLKVAAHHQKRGVGTMLFVGLAESLRRRKKTLQLSDMRLSVFEDNVVASSLYNKLGFIQEGPSWEGELDGWAPSNSPAAASPTISGLPGGASSSSNIRASGTVGSRGSDVRRGTVGWRRYRRFSPFLHPDLLIREWLSFLRPGVAGCAGSKWVGATCGLEYVGGTGGGGPVDPFKGAEKPKRFETMAQVEFFKYWILKLCVDLNILMLDGVGIWGVSMGMRCDVFQAACRECASARGGTVSN